MSTRQGNSQQRLQNSNKFQNFADQVQNQYESDYQDVDMESNDWSASDVKSAELLNKIDENSQLFEPADEGDSNEANNGNGTSSSAAPILPTDDIWNKFNDNLQDEDAGLADYEPACVPYEFDEC